MSVGTDRLEINELALGRRFARASTGSLQHSTIPNPPPSFILEKLHHITAWTTLFIALFRKSDFQFPIAPIYRSCLANGELFS
jgi:hypothetical protein